MGYGTVWIDEGIKAYMETLTLAHWMNKRIKVNNKRVAKKINDEKNVKSRICWRKKPEKDYSNNNKFMGVFGNSHLFLCFHIENPFVVLDSEFVQQQRPKWRRANRISSSRSNIVYQPQNIDKIQKVLVTCFAFQHCCYTTERERALLY